MVNFCRPKIVIQNDCFRYARFWTQKRLTFKPSFHSTVRLAFEQLEIENLYYENNFKTKTILKTVDIQNKLHLDRHFHMKNFYKFSLNKSWVFHFTLAINHDFALYCLIIPIENGIINASKNFMCA